MIIDSSAFKLFFSDIKNTRLLSSREEIDFSAELLKCPCFAVKAVSKKCNKCKHIIDTLVLHNLPLVVRIARKYKSDSISLQDLIGFGIYGLFTAAAKYDHRKKVRFSSYASYWIRDEILNALRTCSGVPSIPPYKITKVWKISKAIRDLSQENVDVTPENIAIHTGFSVVDVLQLQQLLYQVTSLDDIEITSEQASIEQCFCEQEREHLTKKELERILSSSQMTIICSYYGLCGHLEYNFKDISKICALSLERVRQIHSEAIEILKESKLLKVLYGEL